MTAKIAEWARDLEDPVKYGKVRKLWNIWDALETVRGSKPKKRKKSSRKDYIRGLEARASELEGEVGVLAFLLRKSALSGVGICIRSIDHEYSTVLTVDLSLANEASVPEYVRSALGEMEYLVDIPEF